eukprot:g4217.t1
MLRVSATAQFGIWLANTVWAGRVCGVEGLSAVALANLSGNLTGMCVIYGLLSALDTLAPQEMGAGRMREVGMLSQRGAACCLLFFAPFVVLWAHAEPVLLAAGQPARESAVVPRFLVVFATGIPAIVAFETARRFLSAQGIVKPTACVTTLVAAAHPLVLWACVGTECADFERSIPHPHPTVRFLALGVPGILAQSEWWFWESTCFMAGALGSASLSAHAVAYNVIPLCFMVQFGISFGLSTRVGTLLGEGGPSVAVARGLTLRGMLLSMVVGAVLGIGVYAAREPIAHVFVGEARVEGGTPHTAGDPTRDEVPRTLDAVRRIWPAVCLFIVLDGIFAANGGVLRALGLQSRQTVATIVALWAVGVPVLHHAAFSTQRDGPADDTAALGRLWMWMPRIYVLLNTLLVVAFVTVRWDGVSERVRARGPAPDGSSTPGGAAAAPAAVEGGRVAVRVDVNNAAATPSPLVNSHGEAEIVGRAGCHAGGGEIVII